MSVTKRDEIKTLLGILETDTSRDALINNLIGPAEDFVFGSTNNSFELDPHTYYLEASTISFDKTSKKIIDSDSGFADAGFVSGVPIRISGTLLNDGCYRTTEVAPNEITLDLDAEAKESLEDENTGEYCRITMVKLPKDVKMFTAKFIEFHFNNDQQTNGIKSESFGAYSVSYADKNELPPALLKMLAPYRCFP